MTLASTPGEILIPPEHAPARCSRSAATVVAIVTATFVALAVSVPAMVMDDVAAIAFPLTGKILSTAVVRIDPVRARVRGPRPVPVVPYVPPSLRVLITLNPHIVWAGLRRDPISTFSRRWPNANTEGDLRLSNRRGREEQCRDSDCLKKFSHAQCWFGS